MPYSNGVKSMSTTPAQILVVDDDYANQRLMRALLEQLGHRVDTASDGEEALRHLAETDYQLVFMDLDMPGMDGLEATRAWRAREQLAIPPRRVPIIAFSGYVHAVQTVRCQEAGMDDELIKPSPLSLLAAKLAYWLDTTPHAADEKTVTATTQENLQNG